MNCKHFNGLFGPGMVEHKECRAGHAYDSFGPRQPMRKELPCLRDNNQPCPDQIFPTPEEIAAREKEFDEHFKLIASARAAIMATGATRGSSGEVECPKCGKPLHFAIAKLNGHVRAGCETPNCIQWIE